MILVRRGVCDRLLPPVSLVLAGDADGYVRGLTSYRYGDQRDWCDFFSRAAIRAAETAELLARRVGDLQSRWLQAAGRPRALGRACAGRSAAHTSGARVEHGAGDRGTQ